MGPFYQTLSAPTSPTAKSCGMYKFTWGMVNAQVGVRTANPLGWGERH